ncbi:MAG: hypothetical protein Kow0092_02600 [Deferrisomatales bacterium]
MDEPGRDCPDSPHALRLNRYLRCLEFHRSIHHTLHDGALLALCEAYGPPGAGAGSETEPSEDSRGEPPGSSPPGYPRSVEGTAPPRLFAPGRRFPRTGTAADRQPPPAKSLRSETAVSDRS